MDRLNTLANYFNEKERRRLEAKVKENSLGIPEMTIDEIRLSCLENNGYETPELNDKLYLHFRGFRKIENLGAYTGCKSIWLDSNGFDKIENLENLTQLRCLYLAKNLISKIDGLSTLTSLTILDLSNNRLTRIENLSCCPILQTVNFAHNALNTPASISHLVECPSITNIDITNNRLEADEEFFDVLKAIPALVALSINGNEITKLPTFRKRLISCMPKLGYLDRPIDEQERLFAEAFVSGGSEAETAARADWKAKQAEKRVAEMNEFKAWQAEQQRIREQARAEGRSLITELSPEEVSARAAEAQAASEAEREMLSLGIGNLAAQFWQGDRQRKVQSVNGITGLRSSRTTDPLDVAAQKLLRSKEQHQQLAGNESILDSEEIEVELTEVQNSGISNSTANTLDTIQIEKEVGETEVEAEEEEEDEREVEEEMEVKGVPVAAVDSEGRVGSDSEIVDYFRNDPDAGESQDVRDRRVAESLAIYKRQQEELRQRGSNSSSSLYSRSSTWSAASSAASSATTASFDETKTASTEPPKESTLRSQKELEESEKSRPLYWSETMDVQLGKLVKECVFDFDLISEKMIGLASEGAFKDGPSRVKNTPQEALTSDECRLRWSQLDAAIWSDVSLTPSTTALDTVFKICINPSVLGAGHGAQPSFQALASIAAGSKPNYLTVPTSFPSVQDIAEEDVDSDLDLD